MSYPFRRASARLAVGLVAAAVPLVGASVAQAAMAGANPLTTTSRPDLRSVTLTGASSAQFCFDKAVTSVPNVGGFTLGGYRADAFLKSTDAVASGSCVNATFPASVSSDVNDIEQHSFGQVAEGAVRAAGNLGNRGDSTALSGSVSHNGTRGLTTAPDLTGVSVVTSGTQQIAFTYDQNVNPNAIVGSAGFHFETANGTDIASDTASVSTTDPKTVIAQFPVGGGNPLVTDGVRAYSVAGAVQAQTIDHTLGTYDSQALPGSSGITTGGPTLVSAAYSRQPGNNTSTTLNVLGLPVGKTLGAVLGTGFGGTGVNCGTTGTNSCVVVDYTFNEGVNLPLANGITQTILTSVVNNYYAYLSDGSFVHPAAVYEPSGTTTISGTGVNAGNTLGIGGSTTVRAIFPVANRFDEYLVKAAVTGPTTPLGGTPPVCAIAGGVGGLLPSLIGSCAATSSTSTNPGTVGPTLTTTTGAVNAPGTAANLVRRTVAANSTFRPNVPGSAPIGGNAGAFASGFSTAPDAFRVTFDTQTNTASVLFDQRVFLGGTTASAAGLTSSPSNYVLLDGNGNAISAATSISGCPPSTPTCSEKNLATGSTNPAAYTVYLSFPSPAVQVGNGKALEIRGSDGSLSSTFAAVGGSVFATGTTVGNPTSGSGNVQQIVSPASVAAYTHLRAGKVKSYKRMTWAYLHSVLVKELHKTSKHNHKTSKHHRR